MMEDISPAVSVTLTLVSPVCESPANSNCLKLEAETASSSWGSSSKENLDILNTTRVTENGELVHESEEDEIVSIGEDPNVEVLPVDSTSDLSVPLNAVPDTIPIAVQIEGAENGQILAKVISLEDRSIKRRLSDDILTVASKPNEECSSGPTIKESVVSVQLSSEKGPTKGGARSVFELDFLPLWGSVSICGHRPEMEDAVMAVPNSRKFLLRCLWVANYCRDRIHLALIEELKKIKDSLVNGSTRDTRQMQWEKVFTSCFLKVDDEVGGKVSKSITEEDGIACTCTPEPVAPETVGSTAVVVVVSSSHIIVSNCGDSRAVLYRGKEPIALSIDHKPNRDDEYARIEASGGKVIQWNGHRVFGVLAMSRSIGDRYLKPWIIPEPEIMFMPRAREDECLVLASDGLWDVMTNEEACEVARKRILIWHKKNGTNPLPDRGQGVDPAAQAAAEYLSNLALQKGSKDNISIIVVDLKAQRKFKSKSVSS
ncbi:hypothetical protein BUALT_BualtUnG0011000 [Buddleja alternifolia]|uniref:PPM-type phosphatase domain-containing protein n=1 Tax=Buddleja alternifolia TaxID=168488 RepID=A0AAV6W3X8_9LAMI|nr:hypothetical protein BUALT_BualtUnG0011000 [Buddleja alternifolia]